jgi:hypothetical protein
MVPFVLFLLSTLSLVIAQPEGWRMQDRFHGFRYQISGSTEVVEKVTSAADDLGCFGWIQNPRDDVYVGEARCSKERGIKFEEQIKAVHQGSPNQLAIKQYSDTKIRLHFSHFKHLEKERDTCFLDEPHKCSDIRNGGGDGSTSSVRNEL